MERFPSYKRVSLDNEVVELDTLSVYFSDRLLTRDPENYRISAEEAGRPDLIAKNYYGNWSYWWVVMIFNDIIDPFNDLTAGTVIGLPIDEDIISLIRMYKDQNL